MQNIATVSTDPKNVRTKPGNPETGNCYLVLVRYVRWELRKVSECRHMCGHNMHRMCLLFHLMVAMLFLGSQLYKHAVPALNIGCLLPNFLVY